MWVWLPPTDTNNISNNVINYWVDGRIYFDNNNNDDNYNDKDSDIDNDNDNYNVNDKDHYNDNDKEGYTNVLLANTFINNIDNYWVLFSFLFVCFLSYVFWEWVGFIPLFFFCFFCAFRCHNYLISHHFYFEHWADHTF